MASTGGRWRFTAAFAVLILGGCSIPEYMNPFGPDTPEAEAEAAETRARGEAVAEASGEEGFPELAEVPERPVAPTPDTIRDRVEEGLIADRENARYTAEAIRLQSDERPTAVATSPSSVTTGAGGQVASRPASAPLRDASGAAVEAPPAPAPVSPPAAGEPISSETVRTTSATPAPAPVPQRGQVEVPRPPVASGAVAPQTPRDDQLAVPRTLPTGFGRAVRLATIQYGHGSANLDRRDVDILRQVADIQREFGGMLQIIGHASHRVATRDPLSAQLANFNMSLSRANGVAQALMEMGIGAEAISVEAQSDGIPIYAETAPTGEAGNRRVEIFLVR